MYIVITGPIGIGKSTFLRKLGKILSGIYNVGGVITIGQENKEFLNLKTKETYSFREEKNENGIQVGKYFIANRALNFAAKALEDVTDVDVIFLDEIGKLESKKEGLFDSFSKLILTVNEEEKVIILGVRKEIEPQLSELFSIETEKVWILEKHSSEDLLLEVADFIIENYE
ncbi:MAG: AAA family ATPase [Candidatus Heimdallarchaeota archaeon]|nr:AAA family ATPase [Candidatus Heimdallarchaeota archaeon]MCK4877008.1 AAA family ATPase [Candidatus Heimdallarchaeota archaeon]